MADDELRYSTGFGNEFATEAVAGSLPAGRNSPQRAPLGLYAEQPERHAEAGWRQPGYDAVWSGLTRHFR